MRSVYKNPGHLMDQGFAIFGIICRIQEVGGEKCKYEKSYVTLKLRPLIFPRAISRYPMRTPRHRWCRSFLARQYK